MVLLIPVAFIGCFAIVVSAAQAWVFGQPAPRGWDYLIALVGIAVAVPVLGGGLLGMFSLPRAEQVPLALLLFISAFLTAAAAFARGAGRRGRRAAEAATFQDRIWYLLPVHIGVVVAGSTVAALAVFFFAASRIH
jgi:hypothetical protein